MKRVETELKSRGLEGLMSEALERKENRTPEQTLEQLE